MSQALERPMSGEEFLAWEAGQEAKWEFDGVQPLAMAGGTRAHAIIQANIIAALHSRLRGGPCRPVGSYLKVKAGASYRYPDVIVLCTPGDPVTTIVDDPVVMFEIVSETTERVDRSTKLMEYRALPSLMRYLIVEQDEALVTEIARIETGWSLDMLKAERVLDMPEIGISVPVAEIYEGLSFA